MIKEVLWHTPGFLVCLEEIENNEMLVLNSHDSSLLDSMENNIISLNRYLLSIGMVARAFSQSAIDDINCILDSSLCLKKD
jgi:ABC-type Mn2+/Zn2+ transport system ATPase subunit